MKELDIKLEGIYKESDSFKRAREKAMVYLSYSDHTVKSMYKKLSENGFENDDIDEVVSYLVERGYINEKDYFERFCRHCAQKMGYGRRRIEMMALQKGFSKKTFGENADEVFGEIDFLSICEKQLEKSGISDFSDKKVRDKTIASLIRRGFSLSEIKEAMKNILKAE